MLQEDVRIVQAVDDAGSRGDFPTEPAHLDPHERGRKHYASLVTRYFEYAHGGALEEVVAMFADDAFASTPVAPDPLYGKAAIRGFFDQLFRDFPRIDAEILSVMVDGDRAVTEQHMTLTRADGTTLVMPFNTNHFHFEGDLIKIMRVMSSPV